MLGYLASINVFVLLFNLIPGFPLDGGRIARAIAWWRTGDRNRATRFAARLGRGAAFVMIGARRLDVPARRRRRRPLARLHRPVPLPGGAIGRGAGRRLPGGSRGCVVADVMDAEPVAIPETLTLDRAEDEFFLRYGWPWFPVVDASGRLVGVVSREAVDSVAEQVRPLAARGLGHGPRRRRRAACASSSKTRSRRCWAARASPASARSWPWTATACCAGS